MDREKNKINSKLFFVEFRYSSIYDDQCHSTFDLLPKQKRSYPNKKVIVAFMKRLEKEWSKNEQKVFKAIQKYSGIKWTVKKHVCYVVGSGMPFSDPLTIPVFAPQAPMDYVSDVLCHELIHRNLIEPAFLERWNKILAKLKKKFPKNNENVLVHVIVHAIHEQIFLSLFSEERLKRDKCIMFVYKDYHKAWEIVEKVGAKEIINTFLR